MKGGVGSKGAVPNNIWYSPVAHSNTSPCIKRKLAGGVGGECSWWETENVYLNKYFLSTQDLGTYSNTSQKEVDSTLNT